MADDTTTRRPTQSDRDRTRFATGAGRYLADLPHDDALHAAFLRAPFAHAAIRQMDTTAAGQMPGVVAILTDADCAAAGFGNFRALLRQRGQGDRPLVVPFRPALAQDVVRHVGEPVACVIAESRAAAEDAVEAIEIEYEPLPAIAGLDAAQAAGAPLVHDAAPGNLAIDHHAGDRDAVVQAMAAAAHVAEASVILPRLAPVTMEPRGLLASYDAARGVYRLVTPHQGINEIRLDLAAVLNVAPDAIEIALPDVGGGFGARSPAYPEHAALLLAAKRTGRTVRWVGSRSEMFLTDYPGRSTRLSGRLAVDAAGRFTALDIVYETDLGAYITTVAALVNLQNPMQTAGGTYAIPAIAARFVQYFTHSVPIGPYRGAGRPDIALLVERLVDRAAALAGVDPLLMRARNAIPREAFPFRTPFGAVYDSADYPALIDAAREAAGWAGFPARREAAARQGKLRGIGCALFTEVAGGGAVDRDEARVTLSAQDGRVTARIETVTGGSGQSQAETYAFILAARLGMDPADIILDASPSDSRLVGAGSIASRSTISAGSAVAEAGARLAASLLDFAGLRANAPPDELRLVNGRIERGDGSPVMTLAEAVAGCGGRMTEIGSARLSTSFPSGCHVAEVEIDAETGVVSLVSYVAADDAGVVLNPVAAEGQIHGGIVQGLGEVFGEAILQDADGQVLTGSFMDYRMPRADDLPSFVTLDLPVASPHNVLGAKGLGEAGTTGALAAAANAVANALSAVGADLPDLPCTPERIWRALQVGRR